MTETSKPSAVDLSAQLALLCRDQPDGWRNIGRSSARQSPLPSNVDPVSLALLITYTRCLCLRSPQDRWAAQMQFHEAQLARRGGGTMAMKLGWQLRSFLSQEEERQT